MSEERYTSAPETRPGPEDRQRARRASQQRRRRNSVFRYIAVMFGAAFVLLLFTFLMERRQSQQQIDNLKQSASAVQTLQGLMEENEQLKTELSEAEGQLSALRERYSRLETEHSSAQTKLSQAERAIQAMDWFWQIDEAYVRGRYTLCRSLISALEDAQLAEELPRVSITENDRFSPYDRYQEIRGRVVK